MKRFVTLFLFLSFLSGLLLPAFALRITSALILVIVVALFGGDAIAGEANWGNLRYLLMRSGRIHAIFPACRCVARAFPLLRG